LGEQLFEISSGVENKDYIAELIDKLGGNNKEEEQTD